MRPLIGVSCWQEVTPTGQERLFVPRSYFRCVERAGGIPVLLSFQGTAEAAAAALERLDGLLLSGGVDVDPRLYGELPLPQLGRVDPERDTAEIHCTRTAMANGLPLLAICRGIQVLAVAAGGSLYQDIPKQLPGAMKNSQDAPRWADTHGVRIVPGSRLEQLLGAPEVAVNSFHHQAVKAVPAGFVVTATADDGVIEGIEAPTRGFTVGVQWHPEEFIGRSAAFDGLFSGLVEAARAYRSAAPAHR